MIRVNGDERKHRDQTVSQLLEELDVTPRGVAVAIDGEVVVRSAWESTAIPDGSAIEIVTAVAGG